MPHKNVQFAENPGFRQQPIADDAINRDLFKPHHAGDIKPDISDNISAKLYNLHQTEKGDDNKKPNIKAHIRADKIGTKMKPKILKRPVGEEPKKLDIMWYFSDDDEISDETSDEMSDSSEHSDSSSPPRVIFTCPECLYDDSFESNLDQTMSTGSDWSLRSPSLDPSVASTKISGGTGFTTTGSLRSDGIGYLSNEYAPLQAQPISLANTIARETSEALEHADPDWNVPAKFIVRNLEIEESVKIIRPDATAVNRDRISPSNKKEYTKDGSLIISASNENNTKKFTTESKKLESEPDSSISSIFSSPVIRTFTPRQENAIKVSPNDKKPSNTEMTVLFRRDRINNRQSSPPTPTNLIIEPEPTVRSGNVNEIDPARLFEKKEKKTPTSSSTGTSID